MRRGMVGALAVLSNLIICGCIYTTALLAIMHISHTHMHKYHQCQPCVRTRQLFNDGDD